MLEAKQKGLCEVNALLKGHCRGADLVNKTPEKNRIGQASVNSLHTEIHENDSDLTPIFLETRYDPRVRSGLLLVISTSKLANQSHESVLLRKHT